MQVGSTLRSKRKRGNGFLNLTKFNVALLVNQGWRLIENSDSLLARVLKEKYFPHCDFFNSILKTNASYTWRSLWSAKKVVQHVR